MAQQEGWQQDRSFAGLFLVIAIFLAVLSWALTRRYRVQPVILMLLLGAGWRALVQVWPMGAVGDSLLHWMQMKDPAIILYLFLPGLIFGASFNADNHIFSHSLVSILWLAFPCVVGAAVLQALFPLYWYGWDWSLALAYGFLLAATDPVSIIALLQDLGAPMNIRYLMEGESIMNDGSALVGLVIFQRAIDNGYVSGGDIVWIAIRLVLGGFLWGYVMGRLTRLIMAHVRLDVMSEVMLTAGMTWATFLVAETVPSYMDVSGVLACNALGLTLGSTAGRACFTNLSVMRDFWRAIEYLSNTCIFVLTGAFIVDRAVFGSNQVIGLWDLLFAVVLYAGINVIRFILVFISLPLLSRWGYGCTWQEAIILSYSGVRGAIALVGSLLLAGDPAVSDATRQHIIFTTCCLVALTLLINSSTVAMLVGALKVNAVSMEAHRLTRAATLKVFSTVNDTAADIQATIGLSHLRWMFLSHQLAPFFLHMGLTADETVLVPAYDFDDDTLPVIKKSALDVSAILDTSAAGRIRRHERETKPSAPRQVDDADHDHDYGNPRPSAPSLSKDVDEKPLVAVATDYDYGPSPSMSPPHTANLEPVPAAASTPIDHHVVTITEVAAEQLPKHLRVPTAVAAPLLRAARIRYLDIVFSAYWRLYYNGEVDRGALEVLISCTRRCQDGAQYPMYEYRILIDHIMSRAFLGVDRHRRVLLGCIPFRWVSHYTRQQLLHGPLAHQCDLMTGFIRAHQAALALFQSLPAEKQVIQAVSEEVALELDNAEHFMMDMENSYAEIVEAVLAERALDELFRTAEHAIDSMARYGEIGEIESMRMQHALAMARKAAYIPLPSPPTYIQLMEQSGLLVGLNAAERELMVKAAQLQSFRPDDILVKRGTVSAGFFLIVRGSVFLRRAVGGTTAAESTHLIGPKPPGACGSCLRLTHLARHDHTVSSDLKDLEVNTAAERLQPGNVLGALSMLTGQPNDRSVYANGYVDCLYFSARSISQVLGRTSSTALEDCLVRIIARGALSLLDTLKPLSRTSLHRLVSSAEYLRPPPMRPLNLNCHILIVTGTILELISREEQAAPTPPAPQHHAKPWLRGKFDSDGPGSTKQSASQPATPTQKNESPGGAKSTHGTPRTPRHVELPRTVGRAGEFVFVPDAAPDQPEHIGAVRALWKTFDFIRAERYRDCVITCGEGTRLLLFDAESFDALTSSEFQHIQRASQRRVARSIRMTSGVQV